MNINSHYKQRLEIKKKVADRPGSGVETLDLVALGGVTVDIKHIQLQS